MHPFHAEARVRRRPINDPQGVPRWFLSPEDFVVLKIFYGRPKDEIDLERLLELRTDIDLDYVEGWLKKMIADGDPRFEMLARLRAR